MHAENARTEDIEVSLSMHADCELAYLARRNVRCEFANRTRGVGCVSRGTPPVVRRSWAISACVLAHTLNGDEAFQRLDLLQGR